MTDDFASSIARELRSDERLLWQGRPRGGVRLRAIDLYLIPFSLVWCGIIFSMAGAMLLGVKADPASRFLLIPFVAIGLYMLLGRFFVDAMRRKNTAYGVTGRRAIIVVDFFGRQVQSINLHALPEVSLTEKSDGSGTILFGAQPSLSWGRYNPWTGAPSQPAFEMIEEVRRVGKLVDTHRSHRD
jgi:hypothetical protein